MAKTTLVMELWDDEEGDVVPVSLPAHYEVCPECDGHGTKCKLGAMTGEEFHEACHDDPDFAEDYGRGVYDDVCPECKGNNVVLVVTLDYLTPEMRKRIDDHYETQAELAAERRYQERYQF